MKKRLTRLFVLAGTMLLAYGCAEIDQLSDYNRVTGFEILSHTPTGMELGAVEIDGESILIPIEFGKCLFPLRFRAKPILGGDIDRITGIDFSKELVLEDYADEIKFYVMARSGLTQYYIIQAKEIRLDEDAAIDPFFRVRDANPGMIVSEEGVRSVQGDTFTIWTAGGSYPAALTPEFSIAPTARFDGFANGGPFDNGSTALRFDDAQTVHRINVVSESGCVRTWSIALRHAPLISGSDSAIPMEQRRGTDIDPREATASAEGSGPEEVDEVFVDNTTETISFVLKSGGSPVTFPATVRLRFATLEGIRLIGIENNASLTFSGWDDVKEFYLIDPEKGVSRRWRAGIREWLDPGNLIDGFSYSYTASQVVTQYAASESGPAAVLDPSQVDIYPSTGDIYLHLTGVNRADVAGGAADNWQLALQDVAVTTSPNASFTLPAFVWNGNDSWQQPISFTVTAQDGTPKTWRVNVRDMRSVIPGNAAELTGLQITRHKPNYAVFDAVAPVSIDAQAQTATLKLTDDDGCYPLSVWAAFETSPFARVASQSGGGDPLVFDTETSTQTVTVRAEDGTTKNWTVRLQVPPRATGNSVETFQLTSLPSGVDAGGIERNDATNTVRLTLNAAASFPIEVGYAMTVSEKATASVALRGTFTLTSYRDVKTFTVTAQNGSVRTWKMGLRYEPQLENGNLDGWKDANTPNVWATANNPFVKGTTRTEGRSGYGAMIKTQKNAFAGIASGSLFLGVFNRDNVGLISALNDPRKLTFFGHEFACSGKLAGIEVDVIYAPGGEKVGDGSRELASCVVELLKQKPETAGQKFTYHGTPHADNTAYAVAHGEVLLGTSADESWKGTVVSPTQWTTVRIPVEYPADDPDPDFTHLHIVFGSSAKGDLFLGVPGSTLRVDNIKLIYEE